MTDRSFPILVMRLAEERHDGNLLAMSRYVRLPQSTLFRWTHGMAQVPRLDLLERFCDRYDLSLAAVWELVSKDVQRVIAGREVPVPDFSGRQPGPKPKLAEGRKRRR